MFIASFFLMISQVYVVITCAFSNVREKYNLLKHAPPVIFTCFDVNNCRVSRSSAKCGRLFSAIENTLRQFATFNSLWRFVCRHFTSNVFISTSSEIRAGLLHRNTLILHMQFSVNRSTAVLFELQPELVFCFFSLTYCLN